MKNGVDYPIRYKPEAVTFKQHYMCSYLTNKGIAKLGDIELTKINTQLGFPPFYTMLEEAIDHNRIEYVKRLMGLHQFSTTVFNLEIVRCAKNGNLEMLKLFPITHATTRAVNEAAGNNYLDILEYMYMSGGILPNGKGLTEAMHHNHQSVVEWCERRGVELDNMAFFYAIEIWDIELLKKCRVPNDQLGAFIPFFIKHCTCEVLEWLDLNAHGYYIGVLNRVAGLPSNDLLKWCIYDRRFPQPKAYPCAKTVETVDLLYNAGVQITISITREIGINTTVEMMQWFVDHGVIFTTISASLVLSLRNKKLVKWLGERGIFPDVSAISQCYSKSTLKYLHSKGISPQPAIKYAAQKGFRSLLVWIDSIGKIDDINMVIEESYNNDRIVVLDWILHKYPKEMKSFLDTNTAHSPIILSWLSERHMNPNEIHSIFFM